VSVEVASSSSGKLRGVGWVKKRNKWQAQIYYDGEKRRLGCFEDKDERSSEGIRQSCEGHIMGW
jgi:hypothetical protein